MENKIDDGGPIYPGKISVPIASNPKTGEVHWSDVPTGGLTKREWFAATATDNDVNLAAQNFMAQFKRQVCSLAEARYFHADAMIKAGKEKP